MLARVRKSWYGYSSVVSCAVGNFAGTKAARGVATMLSLKELADRT
jgi:hypothetical protein